MFIERSRHNRDYWNESDRSPLKTWNSKKETVPEKDESKEFLENKAADKPSDDDKRHKSKKDWKSSKKHSHSKRRRSGEEKTHKKSSESKSRRKHKSDPEKEKVSEPNEKEAEAMDKAKANDDHWKEGIE